METEVEEGRGASRGCPFPAEGGQVRAPAGEHSGLQAGPHLRASIVPEMEFQRQLCLKPPSSATFGIQLSLSLPTLVSQKPSSRLQISLALSPGQNLSSRSPAPSQAPTRWGSGKAAELAAVLKVPEHSQPT